MPDVLRLLRTASEWAEDNPVLGIGQVGTEEFSNRSKIGNGKTPWNSLAYVVKTTDLDSIDFGGGVTPSDPEEIDGGAP